VLLVSAGFESGEEAQKSVADGLAAKCVPAEAGEGFVRDPDLPVPGEEPVAFILEFVFRLHFNEGVNLVRDGDASHGKCSVCCGLLGPLELKIMLGGDVAEHPGEGVSTLLAVGVVAVEDRYRVGVVDSDPGDVTRAVTGGKSGGD
jgi:hypothetical protein